MQLVFTGLFASDVMCTAPAAWILIFHVDHLPGFQCKYAVHLLHIFKPDSRSTCEFNVLYQDPSSISARLAGRMALIKKPMLFLMLLGVADRSRHYSNDHLFPLANHEIFGA